MKKIKKPSQRESVDVVFNGTTHTASYTIEAGGVVVVEFGRMKQGSILSDPSAHKHEARRLLREILEGDNWQL